MLQSITLTMFFVLCIVNANAFERFQFHLVHSAKDLTADLLKEHGLVLIKEDNSIIVPDLLVGNITGTVDKRKWNKWFHFGFTSRLQYTQTKMSSDRPSISLSDAIPVDGCIDNRYSDTVTTISKTYSRTLLFEAGPHVFISVLGLEAGGQFHLGYFNINDEKLTCDINPGQILQLQATVATVDVVVEKQRTILIILKLFAHDRIEFSDWYPHKVMTPLSFQSTSLACVTKPELLQCK